MSNSGHSGLAVGSGCQVEASCCHFLGAKYAAVSAHAVVIVDKRCSSNRTMGGFLSDGYGAVMALTNCTSTRESVGCGARLGGKLTAHKVEVSESKKVGFEANSVGEVVATDCTALKCGWSGLSACQPGSKMHAEGCSLLRNKICGVCASGEARVSVSGCRSCGNKNGYWSQCSGRMKVSNSCGEGDESGYGLRDWGVLQLDEITVNGVLELSCMLTKSAGGGDDGLDGRLISQQLLTPEQQSLSTA